MLNTYIIKEFIWFPVSEDLLQGHLASKQNIMVEKPGGAKMFNPQSLGSRAQGKSGQRDTLTDMSPVSHLQLALTF